MMTHRASETAFNLDLAQTLLRSAHDLLECVERVGVGLASTERAGRDTDSSRSPDSPIKFARTDVSLLS